MGPKAEARALVRRGRAFYRQGRLREAERLFRRATIADSELGDAFFDLGVVCIDAGRMRSAEAALKSGLALQERSFAFALLGAIQRKSGRLTEARKNYERSLALDPRDDEAHVGLALTLAVTEPQRALLHFKSAARIDPSYEGLHREMGKVLWRLKRMREAERSFRKAVRLYPDDPWAHSYLGSVRMHSERWPAALREFLAAVELVPRWPLFWADVGLAYVKLGQPTQAEAAFRRALSLDIADVTSNLRYGQFLMLRGQLTRAERFFRRVLRKDPTNVKAQRALDRLEQNKQTH